MFEKSSISGYSKYNIEAKKRNKINPLETIYPPLPNEKFDVIYADHLGIMAVKCSMINQVLKQ